MSKRRGRIPGMAAQHPPQLDAMPPYDRRLLGLIALVAGEGGECEMPPLYGIGAVLDDEQPTYLRLAVLIGLMNEGAAGDDPSWNDLVSAATELRVPEWRSAAFVLCSSVEEIEAAFVRLFRGASKSMVIKRAELPWVAGGDAT